LTEVGPASICFLAIVEEEIYKQNRVPSSAAIRLPTSVLATKFRLSAGLAQTTNFTDIIKTFGAEAAPLEDEKRFFR
jgi:hypothetical protein